MLGENYALEASKTYYDRVDGPDYLAALGRLHELAKPRTYFEIGTQTGASLQKASGVSVAIDPQFILRTNIMQNKSACFLYQMTSDEFFQKCDLAKVLQHPVDIAFLDGMHLYEYLLRDFYNTERYCTSRSVIVLHDCVPGEHAIATRALSDPVRKTALHPDWWTGDVWKMVPILRRYRPDLRITITDAKPTGLAFVTNLDPKDDTLRRKYDEIVEQYADIDEGTALDEFVRSANIVPTIPYISTFRDAFTRDNRPGLTRRAAMNLKSWRKRIRSHIALR